MRVVPFAPAAADALRRYDEAGGVLVFVRFDREDGDPVGEDLHRRAALAGVAEGFIRWAKDVDAPALTTRLVRRAAPAAGVDPAGLARRRITARELYGPGFADGNLVLLGEWSGTHSPPETLDFAYAFCSPPYSLRLSSAELESLFGEVVKHVLGGPDQHTAIWSWETGWSPYFDAGREWWGTALWTVDVADSVVVILASSSD